ncbi:MAG TPA: YqaE/Pmp3 family membrane protein [Chitinophagaceae bacterium]|nr:YqaE/Pmp3 family membrane protein [Chitinophagaceae bacterium]
MKKILCSLLMAALMISIVPLESSASRVLPGSSEPDPATVKAALAEFRNLSKKEKKERVKEVKKQLKIFKKEKKTKKTAEVEMWVLIVLAILLPPLAVYLHQGEINTKFWLSILFWILFIIPGVIYALLVVTDTI